MPKPAQTKDPFLNYSSDDSSNEDEADDCKNCCTPQNYNYFATFLRESSIHGLKYIGQLQQGRFVRIFWVIMFLVGVGTSVYLIMIGVVADLQANPVIMSFQESEITIDRVPFPAVTICSSSKRNNDLYLEQVTEYNQMYMDWKKREAAGAQLTLEETQDVNRRFYALIYLIDLCRDSNAFSTHFTTQNLTRSIDQFPLLDNSELDFLMKYARKVLHDCDDIVLLCLWANKPINCSTQFVPIITEYGNCCSFNMMPEFILRKNHPNRLRKNNSTGKVNRNRRRRVEEEIKAWDNWAIDKHLIEKDLEETAQEKNKTEKIDIPKHQRSAGMTSGLSILIHPDFDQTDEGRSIGCDSLDGVGFRVQVHSPIDYPHISDFGKTIQSNTENFVDITAAITMPDKEVEEISKEKRQCYFNDEYNLTAFKDYTQKNCVDECIIDEVYRKCNCVRIYMPRKTQPLCINPHDYACIKNATAIIMDKGTLDFCSHCWPSCTQVEYFATTTEFPLRDDVEIWRKAFANGENPVSNWSAKDVAIVHLFFSKETVESRARKSLYGAMEILAGTGGVLGLTLGISMISLVEPIYFLTIRLFFERKTEKTSRRPIMVSESEKREQKKTSKPMQIFVQPAQKKMNDQQKFIVKHIPRAWIQN